MRCCACLALLALLVLAPGVSAHPLAPALLALTETDSGEVAVRWRLAAVQPTGARLQPVLPVHCTPLAPPRTALDGAAFEMRWRSDCGTQGLRGHAVGVSGGAGSGINTIVLVRNRHAETIAQGMIDGGASYTVPQRAEPLAVAMRYAELGVTHLVFGPDHLLFVAGLFLLVSGWRRLLVVTAAFTLGHSVTLALSVLDVVRLDPALTELAIAASVVWLALHVLARRLTGQADGMWRATRAPWFAAGFGLLHGLGFAGALREIGLPQEALGIALAAFNVGIEVGQILVLGVLAACGAMLARVPVEPATGVARLVTAYAMGTFGACWCLERSMRALELVPATP